MDAIRLHVRKSPGAPKGLSGKARTFWLAVLRDYELEDFHLTVLEQACWALQRSEAARRRVDQEGQTYICPRTGRVLLNPCTGIEERNRVIFTRTVRELGLDLDQSEPSRPPTRAGRTRR